MRRQPDELLEEAQQLSEQASLLWNERAYPGTEVLCRRALKLTRSAVGDRDPRVAEQLYNLAALYHFQYRFEEAKPLYLEAIFIHEAQKKTDHLALAFCYAWLGKTLFEAWRDDPGIDAGEEGRAFEEAEACYRKTLGLLKGAGADDTAEYAACLMHMGFLYYYCDMFAQAEPYFLQALTLREALFGPDHPETAESVGRLAILYWHGDNAASNAEPLLRRALHIYEAQPEAHPQVWEWTYRLAEFCHASGRRKEAGKLFARLTKRLLDIADPLDDDVDWIVSGCLDYLRDTGQVTVAAAIVARWNHEDAGIRKKRSELKRRETMLGPDHPRVADSLCALADELRFYEKIEEAEALYTRARVIIESDAGLMSPNLLPILNGLARLLGAQGKIEAARGVLERAADIPFTPDMPAERCEHARALEQLAWVCSAENRGEQAEALIRRAIAVIEDGSDCDYREAAEMRYRLAIFHANEGRYTDAEESLLAALRSADMATELDALEIADYREQYAVVLTAMGRGEEAAAQAAEVTRIWAQLKESR